MRHALLDWTAWQSCGGSGLQPATLRSIALAWLFTQPASLFPGGAFYLLARAVLAVFAGAVGTPAG